MKLSAGKFLPPCRQKISELLWIRVEISILFVLIRIPQGVRTKYKHLTVFPVIIRRSSPPILPQFTTFLDSYTTHPLPPLTCHSWLRIMLVMTNSKTGESIIPLGVAFSLEIRSWNLKLLFIVVFLLLFLFY